MGPEQPKHIIWPRPLNRITNPFAFPPPLSPSLSLCQKKKLRVSVSLPSVVRLRILQLVVSFQALNLSFFSSDFYCSRPFSCIHTCTQTQEGLCEITIGPSIHVRRGRKKQLQVNEDFKECSWSICCGNWLWHCSFWDPTLGFLILYNTILDLIILGDNGLVFWKWVYHDLLSTLSLPLLIKPFSMLRHILGIMMRMLVEIVYYLTFILFVSCGFLC